jgi:hypothetical protein
MEIPFETGPGPAMRPLFLLSLVTLTTAWLAGPALAGSLEKYLGETSYVPAYSRIFTFADRHELLAVNLTIHNVDPATEITIETVSYYNDKGENLKELAAETITLPPFGSKSFLVPRNDVTAGVGANFIVRWQSETPALSPIVEAVMIGGINTPGASFTSRGRVIERKEAP